MNLANIGVLRGNPFAIRDNLLLNDVNVAIEELLEFKKADGNAVADATTKNRGRDPRALRTISIETSIHIIMGGGYYLEKSSSSLLCSKTTSQIAEEMIKEIKKGINGTDILPGMIGEIGTSKDIAENEEKVLRAAASTQLETGLTTVVHPYPWGTTGMQILVANPKRALTGEN